MLVEQIEGAVHAAEHAEAQHIDLHELEGIDIILVPFDDLPVFHPRGLDRHQVIQPVLGQHEPAGMLREMARRADQLARQLQRELQPMIIGIQIEALNLLPGYSVHRPAPDKAGQHLGEISRQAQCLADLGHRAPRTVAGDHRGQRRAGAAIGLIDPLDDFLTPLMFEIYIDVRRLLAFA